MTYNTVTIGQSEYFTKNINHDIMALIEAKEKGWRLWQTTTTEYILTKKA